jgi:hypothetical protein
MSEDFGCVHGRRITRRGGPDIGCDAAEQSQRCGALFERLKTAALPAFDVVDDLTQMPHSVLVKIQYGGLLGLAEALGGDGARIEDVSALAGRAQDEWGRIDAIPAEQWADRMTGFKLRRRRGR